MPNWCENVLTVHHDDETMLVKFREAVASNRLFNTFVPEPSDIGDDWHGWRLENWGTRWEADFNGRLSSDVEKVDDGALRIYFLTAWSPPVDFARHLVSLGFTVNLVFAEPGCDFAGCFDSEVDKDSEMALSTLCDIVRKLQLEVDGHPMIL